jgi:molybdopterin/thiamine biosynthesis adenylyltransferase
MTANLNNSQTFKHEILNPNDSESLARIHELMQLSDVQVYDEIDSQLLELVKIRNPKLPYAAHVELLNQKVDQYKSSFDGEVGTWIFYHWNKRLIKVLDESDYIEVRTNRNRNKIRKEEQAELNKKVVGIAGLSVGRSVAIAMTLERSYGEVRLADFDVLELSNLNRLQAPISELGLNKAVAVAREILSLDPYLRVKVFADGLHEGNISKFFSDEKKMDLFIEECDSLRIKIISRIEAKRLGIPVLMEASDRCLLDIERFDEELDRPILHGLVDDLPLESLQNLKTDEDKLPYLLKMVGLESLTPKLKASMLEIQQTLVSWPQLGSAVKIGGGITAEVARKILLGEVSGSGRFYLDVEKFIPLLSNSESKVFSGYRKKETEGLSADTLNERIEQVVMKFPECLIDDIILEQLLLAANRAPSGGNSQPWRWIWKERRLFLFLDPSNSNSLMDSHNQAAFIALGASAENLRIRANAMGFGVKFQMLDEGFLPLVAVAGITKSDKMISHNAQLMSDGINSRNTNRTIMEEKSERISEELLMELRSEIDQFSEYRLVFCEDYVSESISEIIAEVERLRMLHPRGHSDFVDELRWTKEDVESTGDGIDIATINLSPLEMAGMLISRDPSVMDELDRKEEGNNFKKLSKRAIKVASHLGVLVVKSDKLMKWFEGGRALERIWIKANNLGIQFQPHSPISFLANTELGDTTEVKEHLGQVKRILKIDETEEVLFVFRLFFGDKPIIDSRRRPILKSSLLEF